MRLVFKRDRIRSVRDRWFEQYKNYPGDKTFVMRNPKTVAQIQADLSDLDLETCSSSDVDKAIGVAGWVDFACDECGKSVLWRIRHKKFSARPLCKTGGT